MAGSAAAAAGSGAGVGAPMTVRRWLTARWRAVGVVLFTHSAAIGMMGAHGLLDCAQKRVSVLLLDHRAENPWDNSGVQGVETLARISSKISCRGASKSVQ